MVLNGGGQTDNEDGRGKGKRAGRKLAPFATIALWETSEPWF